MSADIFVPFSPTKSKSLSEEGIVGEIYVLRYLGQYKIEYVIGIYLGHNAFLALGKTLCINGWPCRSVYPIHGKNFSEKKLRNFLEVMVL